MDLRSYLNSHQIGRSHFAAAIGVTPQALHRYITGERLPRRQIMQRIAEKTAGSVTAADFYEGADAEEAA